MASYLFWPEVSQAVRLCETVLEEAKGKALSEEEEKYLEVLAPFYEYVNGLHPDKDSTADMQVILQLVKLIKPLILGPLVKPETGSPAEWIARDDVTWQEWNKWYDPMPDFIRASNQVMVQDEDGMWYPLGLIEEDE